MAAQDSVEQPLQSVYTSSLIDIFKQLKISLVVSTYQAGKVILVRYDETPTDDNPGGTINTHFRNFEKPMGITVKDNRLTIGGSRTVWEYRNMPAVAAKLEPSDKHDACYLPRSIHITGDIDIHEMDWSDDDELWLVNTRFCCLCTLDVDHSFNPRWRPHFVSALAPEDRCHLNGLAMVDGKPTYVTALGETDTQGGWRANKADGGILMHVDSNEVLLRGLSMPHSPRWYQGKLWVLESGKGALSVVDPEKGTWETVATMPGFTRGIDFVGPLAFIGLSQVRESAVFSGIPIVKDLTERTCGIWVVHIETGETLGFLRFESGVQEIFAVQALQGIQFPEMLEWDNPLISSSYVLPDDALADVSLPDPETQTETPQHAMRTGVEHFHKREFTEAIKAFETCLERQADFPEARYSLAVALAETGRTDEALSYLQTVIDKEPDRTEIHHSMGSLYQRLGKQEKAIAAFEEAIRRQSENAMAHMSLGQTLLQQGDFERGFEEYEWRLKAGQIPPLQCPHPVWDGSDITEKRLLIHAELNNPEHAILLARYIPALAEKCSQLIMMCNDELLPLFSSVSALHNVCKADQVKVSDFDVHISLDSVPYILQTRSDSIPLATGWIDLDILRRRKQPAVLPAAVTKLDKKIGVVWAAGSEEQTNPHRDCSFDVFKSLLTASGATFYLFNQTQEDAALPENCISLYEQITDHGDLALAVEQLDLVIGVESVPVHIAGLLNIPAWVMLGDVTDWCWPASGEKGHWYPGSKMYRQPKPGDWPGLVKQVRQSLE